MKQSLRIVAFTVCILLTNLNGWAQAASATWALTANSSAAIVGNVSGGAQSGGTGIGTMSYTTNGVSSNGWGTTGLDANDYYQFSIAPTTGNDLTITSIATTNNLSSQTATGEVQYSYSSSFTSPVSVGSAFALTTTATTTTASSLSISVTSGQTLYVRVFIYKAGANTITASQTVRCKNFTITGTTATSGGCAAPTVNSTSTANITTAAADLNGNIAAVGGGANVTARGFEYATNSSLTTPTTISTTGTYSTGTFTQTTGTLASNTRYYYRAFGTNNCASPQTAYSHTSSFPSFYTKPDAPTANAPTNATSSGFDVSWNNVSGAEAETYLLEVSTTNFGTPVLSVNVGAVTSYTITSGLSPLTTYFYRVTAVNTGQSSTPSNVPASITTLTGPCGSESFTNSNLTATYAASSFTGDNGVTWTYVESRDESTYGITGKGIMLRRLSDGSKVTSSSVAGGIGDFTCSLRKAFTAAGNRQVELFVNGVSKGTSLAWDNTSVQTFTVTGINITGPVVVEIRNITGNQVIVDDISWTCKAQCTTAAVGSTSNTPVVCFGDGLGSITVTGSGSATPYTYSKDNGSNYQSSNSFTSLLPGSYNIKVKGNDDCESAATSVTVGGPTSELSFTYSQSNVTTSGGSDGSITVTASGGTSGYSYSKNSGTNYQGSNSFTGLSATTYPVKVKDANNCETAAQSVVIIEEVPTITTSILIPNFICPGSTVSVPYTITGSFLASNTFTAQLSDASGSFVPTPTPIGTLTNTNTSGTITATIPANTPAGTGYRIRVVGSAPAIIGSDNGVDITIQFNNSTPIFAEGMGSTAYATIGLCEVADGFDNDVYTMSGAAEIRTSTSSSGYQDASAGGNVYLAANALATFRMEGINTTATGPLALNFGVQKSTTTDDGSGLVVEYSTNSGSLWTPITLQAMQTGPGTTAWYFVKLVDVVPHASNLWIQFRNTNTTVLNHTAAFRIDDIGIYTGAAATVSITPSSPPTQCGGTIALQAAPASATYSWTGGTTASTLAVGTTGDFSVTVTDRFGCSASAGPVDVTINTPITASVSISPTTACAGNNNTFTANPVNGGNNPTYVWKKNGSVFSPSQTNSTLVNPTLAEGDAITCEMVSNDACFVPATAISNSVTAQKFAYSPITTVWTEDFGTGSTTLSLTYAGYTNSQTPPLGFACNTTGNSLDIRTSNAGPNGGSNVFFPTYSAGSTPATKFLTISNINTTNAFPNRLSFNLGTVNSSSTFPSAGFTVEYSTDGVNFTPMSYPTFSTVFLSGSSYWSSTPVILNESLPYGSNIRVRFTSTSLSLRLDDVKLEKYTVGDAVITAPSLTVCAPATITLTASATPGTSPSGFTYKWNDNSMASTLANANGNYSVTLTDGFGCKSSASVTATVNPLPTATAGGALSDICQSGTSAQMGGSVGGGATGGTWSGGAGTWTNATNPATATYTASASESGSITLTLTTSGGSCGTTTAAKSITVNTCTNTWLGTTAQWNLGSNWTSGSFPNSCSDDAIIPSGLTNYPLIGTATFTVGNLTIQSGATITVNAPLGGLNVCGNLTGGTTTDAVVTGTGELRMVGNATQTISGKINLNTLRILTSTTAITVNVTGNISLNKALVMDKGKVANSGTVTLKSNAATTAYLDNFTSATPGTYTGNLTVERYLTNKNDGYRNISSPVTTKVSDLNDDFPVIGQNGVNCWYSYNPYPNVQYYNESLNNPNNTYPVGFVSYTGLTNTLTAMKGLAARIYPNNTNLTLDFTGKPYTGNKSFPITFTNTGSIAADGWNLVGNCYPSPILWGKVKQANPGEIDAAYYVFQTTGEFTGNWGSYNGTTSVNGATNEIGIGQGFWVLASGNTTLDMNQGVRTAKETTQFFKTDELQSDEIRLSIGNGTQMDEIVTYTDPNGTKGYDRDYDAVKMPGSTVSMSFMNESNEYAINVIDAITAQTELPLNITTEEEGVYSISATELNTELPVYLKDQVSNTLSDLKAGSVSIYLNKGEVYNNSYSVVFDAPQVSGINTTENNPIRIYSYNNRLVVERPTNSTATINVSNVLGQQVMNISTTTERTELPMTANEPWYAFVKVTEGNKVSVAKVLIKNK